MRFSRYGASCAALVFLCAGVSPSFASPAGELPGESMSLLWALPFAGLLLSIATGPVLYPHFWEHHYGKFSAFWGALAIVPLFFWAGPSLATTAALHTIILEYIPFIILIFALFTIAGGMLVAGNIHGTPLMNAALLVIGAILASFVGTTGASMIMIRPLIRANDNRPFNAHVVIFFIFLVSNIGGSLTPLGDPPLFVGFLRGVDFFWTTQHLLEETAVVLAIVLAVFFAIDWYFHVREEGMPKIKDPTPDKKVRLRGLVNLPLLAGVIGAILLSAWWHPGISFSLHGVEIELQDLARDVIMVAMALLSLALSRKEYRRANDFAWGPIVEVAKLFAAIFVCLIPVTAMLHAGSQGALAPLVAFVTNADGSANPLAYFWLTGVLSSFLDNAPTYLVFFDLAGGDPHTLMTEGAAVLAAISSGAVFMGANSYIGNAPNFMVYAIARHQGVRMPHFFAYMLWSGCVLIPTFLFAGWLFFT
ncbi:sodium:proton antiporter [Mesorhizobium koreense]|uniref:sodium:proton antiporter n=1 Tax=Mesorhizobium koreense TaxID=3074855 RepID=UPI00287B6944|nr:sodium:proton antiporter [Mesorhizobium sp. WR6]